MSHMYTIFDRFWNNLCVFHSILLCESIGEYSAGDVLQLPVLVLEVGQFRPKSLEGGFQKPKVGHVNVPYRLGPTS